MLDNLREINFPPVDKSKYFVYLLSCSDNSLYCGSVSYSLDERVRRHNSGDGAIWTRMRRPVKLVYYED